MHRYLKILHLEKQAREDEKQHVSLHPDSQISIDSWSWSEIRTILKKSKGLWQGRNLIKMEIRPRDVKLCFCVLCSDGMVQPYKVIFL